MYATNLRRLEKHNVLQRGHFRLSSGKHSGVYLQAQQLFSDPVAATGLIAGCVGVSKIRNLEVDVVVAPAVGAICVGYEVARALGCRFVFAERVDGVLRFRRGQELVPGENVLVVEDVITTGGTTREMIRLCQGTSIVGVFALCDRTKGQFVDYPLWSVVKVEADVFDAEDCPYCAANTPVNSPGSRHPL